MKTRFGPFTLDPGTRQLLRDGQEIRLPRKAFELLTTLLGQRPKVVSKDELQAALWPDSHVDAAGLNVLVSEVRRALDDEARQPRFIRTVHGVGYAFCGDAVHLPIQDESAPVVTAPPSCWLAWGEKRFRLVDGENLIGRDPASGIWIDADGVSRRHASVQVDLVLGTAVLRDLDSTNGTFLGRAPVSEPVALSDGDEVRVGSVALTFRRWSSDRAAETRRIRRKP